MTSNINPPKCSVCYQEWAIPCDICKGSLLCLTHLKDHQMVEHDLASIKLNKKISKDMDKLKASKAIGTCMICEKSQSTIYLLGAQQPIDLSPNDPNDDHVLLDGVAMFWTCIRCIIEYFNGNAKPTVHSNNPVEKLLRKQRVNPEVPLIVAPLIEWSRIADEVHEHISLN